MSIDIPVSPAYYWSLNSGMDDSISLVNSINAAQELAFLRQEALMVKDTYSKMLLLKFPKTSSQRPLVCNLAKEFDLTFNILNATIFPRKEGVMVLQLFGTPQNFDAGVAYLKSEGIKVQKTAEDIGRNEDVCTHCGTCTAVCPTGALSVSRPKMEVVFDQEKCSVCKLCVTVCPPRAMNLHPADDLLQP